jgi:nucleoside-diphosphate-sugar epimerase
MNVAITGATGFIGRYLTAHLVSEGMTVRPLARTASVRDRASALCLTEVNYEDAESIERGLQGSETVVHLVGCAHAYGADEATYDLINVGYTRRVMSACVAVGAKRVIFMSSVKALGNGGDRPYTHGSLPRPEDSYGRSKVRAEAIVRAMAAEFGLDYVILRPPPVYGSGVRGNLRRLIHAIEMGWPVPVPSPEAGPRSLISLQNLSSAIGKSIRHRSTICETYLISDGHDVTMTELIKLIANIGHKPARTLPIPASLLRGLASFGGGRASTQRLLRASCVDGRRFEEQFEWAPNRDLEFGLREAIEAYRAERARLPDGR